MSDSEIVGHRAISRFCGGRRDFEIPSWRIAGIMRRRTSLQWSCRMNTAVRGGMEKPSSRIWRRPKGAN